MAPSGPQISTSSGASSTVAILMAMEGCSVETLSFSPEVPLLCAAPNAAVGMTPLMFILRI